MKKLFFLMFAIIIIATSASYSQDNNLPTYPEYPSGDEALMEYIKDNFKYPENALKKRNRRICLCRIYCK